MGYKLKVNKITLQKPTRIFNYPYSPNLLSHLYSLHYMIKHQSFDSNVATIYKKVNAVNFEMRHYCPLLLN